MTRTVEHVTTVSRPVLWLTRGFLCIVIVVESASYGVISPLLRRLADDLALDNLSVGVVMGAFTAGMFPSCIGLLLVRRSISNVAVVLGGLVVAGTGCLVFAHVPGIAGPIGGRILMGFGSALCYSAASRWLVRSAPGHEAFFFGIGWGLLSVGLATGPLLGALAANHGPVLVHTALAAAFAACVACLAPLAGVRRLRQMARTPAVEGSGSALSLMRDGPFRAALAPVVVPALAIGSLFTIIPLRFAGSGHTAWVGPVFTAAAVVGAATGPLAGAAARRVGARPLTIGTLAAGAVCALAMGLPLSAGGVAAATIAVLGTTNEGTVVITLVFAIFETLGAVLAAKAQDLSTSLP